jgi:hypothetical protein
MTASALVTSSVTVDVPHLISTLLTILTDIEFEFVAFAQTQLAKAVTPDAGSQVCVIWLTAIMNASEAQEAKLVI